MNPSVARPAVFAVLLALVPTAAAAQSPPLQVNAPMADAFLSDATPLFSGITAADAEVTVTVDDRVANTTANGTGDWTVELAELEDGPYTAAVVASDGVEMSATVDVPFTIDTIPPALVLVSPKDNSLVEPTLLVSGNSDPATAIEVYVDDVLVATTESLDSGAWTIRIPDSGELAAGVHALTVAATDEAGNESVLTITIEVIGPPDNTDTDDDGLFDRIESVIGTDLDDPDTDGDGLTDFEEFERWQTNPLAKDTDSDGVDDRDEIEAGTDPRARELGVGDGDGDGVGGMGCGVVGTGEGIGGMGLGMGIWIGIGLVFGWRRRFW